MTLFGRMLALAGADDASVEVRIRMQTLVHALWLEILDSTSLTVVRKAPEVYTAIAERMKLEPEREYPLDSLVAEAGVSKASFIAMFKTAHGFTPHAYLLHCRIAESKRLLEDGLPVKVVADRLGFPTPQHFSRTFRNFVGMTPVKWLASVSA